MPQITIENGPASDEMIVAVEIQPGTPKMALDLAPGEQSEPIEVEAAGHYNLFIFFEGHERPRTRHVYVAENDDIVETFHSD